MRVCWHLPVKYRVLFEQDEDGVFIATCPALPGCISQRRTRAKAQANVREAITGCMKSLKKHSEPIPPGIEEKVMEIAAG
jgi:antitoxin HicB